MLKRNKPVLIETAIFLLMVIFRICLKGAFLDAAMLQLLENISDVMMLVLYLVSSFELFKGMIDEIREERNFFSEELLMVVASVAAVFLGDFSEAAAIAVLFRLGESLADDCADKSRDEIGWLLDLHVTKCRIVRDGAESEMGVGDVRVGDIAVLSPGDVVPFDCRIISGKSNFDTSSITGESEPRPYGPGDGIYSGYSVCDGVVRAEVVNECKDSTVAEILKMIDDASSSKSESARVMSKFAAVYTPAVLMLSFVAAVVPPLVMRTNDFATWAYRAIGILVASCPCSIVLSVPLAYFTGSACLAKRKVFVRNSSALDRICKSDEFCFDKTGTLTDGVFSIAAFETNLDEKRFKRIASSAESFSKHPVAKAIFSEWKEYSDASLVSDYREEAGEGIRFEFEGGRYAMIGETDCGSFGSSVVPEGAKTAVRVEENGQAIGRIYLTDRVRCGSKETLGFLRGRGIECAMLTGDRAASASSAASALGISKFQSELKPQDKLKFIKGLQSEGKTVVFIGDGINDAPAVSAADVGIAMGGVSSESIRRASDVVLEGNSISGVVDLLLVARKTRNIAIANIAMSLVLKVAVIVLSFAGIAPIWLNIAADGGMLVLTVLNVLRLRRFQPWHSQSFAIRE